MENHLTVQHVRNALSRLMEHHACEISRWKDTLAAHADEGDYLLNAQISIKAASHQAAWNAVFDVAKVLRIGLGNPTEDKTKEGDDTAHG